MFIPRRYQIWHSTARLLVAVALIALLAGAVLADTPGRGRTAAFEQEYLRFIINHHASALRMTELAAGTDATRDGVMDPAEGTSPTPGFGTTSGKTRLDQIRSMARMANRVQREEIGKAQKMLRDWYGTSATPSITPEGQQRIRALEQAPAGRDFDRVFLEEFSRHHYGALKPSIDCQVNRELEHDELDRYCRGIVHMQVNEITDMRELLCREFSVCDLQVSQ